MKTYREHVKIIPQFKIGEYIRAEYAKQIPKYRVDFLMTFSKGGKEQALILEYDGVEYHTKNPDIVIGHNQENFSGNNLFMSCFVALQIPLSVIKPVTSLAGVTSNAKLAAGLLAGGIRTLFIEP